MQLEKTLLKHEFMGINFNNGNAVYYMAHFPSNILISGPLYTLN